MKKLSKIIFTAFVFAAVFFAFCVVGSAEFDTDTGLEYELNGSSYTVISYSDTSFNGNLTIPSEYNGTPVKKIGAKAFQSCNFSAVTIPSSVTSVSDYAFFGCTNLKSVVFESSSTKVSLKAGAFSGCENLNSIVFPENITYIPEKCFEGCSSLTSIKIPETVTQIAKEAFINCTGLESVTIPSSVVSIGNGPFFRCTSLKTITVSGGENYKTVNGVLYSYDGSELVQYPTGRTSETYTVASGTETICYGAFAYSVLSSITFDSGLKEIEEYAFYKCGNLISVSVPDGVETIGADAFLECSALKSVTIPGSVTDFDSAFQSSGLENVVISSGVSEISNNAFQDCTSLQSVTLNDGLTTIGSGSFYGCSSLSQITVPSSVTSIEASAFTGCASPFTMTVAKDSYAEQFAVSNGYTVVYQNSDDADNLSKASVSVPGGKTVNYKYKVKMTATAQNLPSGYYVQWFDSNGNAVSDRSASSSTFTTGSLTSSSYTYTAKIVDENGTVVSSASQQKSVTIKVNTDFISKIISFFSRLFGSDVVTL